MQYIESKAVTAASPQDNITDLLEQQFAANPDRVLFSVPNGSGWINKTTAEFRSEVIALAKGFIAAGIEPGSRIAIMSKTRYEWTLLDFALFYAGAAVVPIYETSSALQIHWIMEDSGATGIFVENADHASRVDQIISDLPEVKHVWQIDGSDLADLVAAGADIPDSEVEKRRNIAVSEDLATIIYTSGSFGRPKGCVLTHANFVELSRNTRISLSEMVDQPGCATLLFIPLAHVFARFISILCVHGGIRVGYAEPKELLDALGSFKPTFLLAVPRVFEKVYNGAEQKAEAGGKGKIFRAAAKTAVAYSKALDTGRVPLPLKLKFKLFDKLVFAKLRQALGGQVSFAVSGSAPLSTFLGHFYRALGIEILEGYGLTETTAPITVGLPGKTKIGTVGPPLPGTSVKIAEDGEILTRGINVFKEYWNNPELTAEAFTEDGFFHTGDLGELDSDGYLKITGRKKEIIVTAGGKNVAPAMLENPIRSNPIVGHPVVVGDKRPFIACLITLDPEMLPTWLSNNGENPEMTLAEAAENPKVLAEVQRSIDEANEYVSRAESIRKFKILPVEFTEDSGHLTPKMSIKRSNILQDFSAEIDAIYDAPAPPTSRIHTIQQ